MDIIEQVARALCVMDGKDPDNSFHIATGYYTQQGNYLVPQYDTYIAWVQYQSKAQRLCEMFQIQPIEPITLTEQELLNRLDDLIKPAEAA